MKNFLLFSFMLLGFSLSASDSDNEITMDTLPYYQIPDYPESFDQSTIVARMIDGLGYRYFWATKDLRTEDLAFDPGGENRSPRIVLEHIHGLTNTVLNAVKNVVNTRVPTDEMSWEDLRKNTLSNLESASNLLKTNKVRSLENNKLIFQRGDTTREYPFWNLLNGPLADAIYHTGQIVSYRRSSGNPIDPNVSVFRGKTRVSSK